MNDRRGIGSDAFVLIENGPGGGPALFTAPREVIAPRRLDEVPAALERLEAARAEGLWIAGLAAYELGHALEPKLHACLDDTRDAPLMRFGLFDGPVDGAALLARADAEAPGAGIDAMRPLWSEAAYGAAFAEVKAMLGRGDLYQVNLTMPLELGLHGSPLALFGALRAMQPVGHGALVSLGGAPVISRSPELFFEVDGQGLIRVAPMKGTAPRGAEPAEDAALRAALAADEKNQAENVMIVDLMRNDLSRIARTGSVRVRDLMAIETYETVHQMVSRIEARLLPEVRIPALFHALFPCGSITGAPKIAAMQAIRDLEAGPRGAYCGSIGWIAPDGRAAFNVAIRTLEVTAPGKAVLGVGGGIVQDSVCEAEYEEALWKARFATRLIPA